MSKILSRDKFIETTRYMDDLVKQHSSLVARLNEHDAAQREKIERLKVLLERVPRRGEAYGLPEKSE